MGRGIQQSIYDSSSLVLSCDHIFLGGLTTENFCFQFYFYYLCVCACAHVHAHMGVIFVECRWLQRPEASDPSGAGLTVNSLMCALGIELQSSGRAVHALNF